MIPADDSIVLFKYLCVGFSIYTIGCRVKRDQKLARYIYI